MKAKPIFTYEPAEAKVRLFRVLWNRDETKNDRAYSAFVSFTLQPKLFHAFRARNQWRVIICGFGIHYCRSYGGRFV